MAAPPTLQATTSRCPQPGLPHRRPQPYRPHQAAPSSHPPATAPKASTHTHTRKYGGVSITPTPPYSTTTPTMRAHPSHTTQDTTTPTNTHPAGTTTRATPRPLQARKTCATRTQAPTTHPQQTSRQRAPHAHTATPPRPSPSTATAPATTTHPSQPQPPRHEAPTREDTSSTTAARTAHNALTSTNTKHHNTEITGDKKTFPRHPREQPPHPPPPDRTRLTSPGCAQVTDLNESRSHLRVRQYNPGIVRKTRGWRAVSGALELDCNRPCRGS